MSSSRATCNGRPPLVQCVIGDSNVYCIAGTRRNPAVRHQRPYARAMGYANVGPCRCAKRHDACEHHRHRQRGCCDCGSARCKCSAEAPDVCACGAGATQAALNREWRRPFACRAALAEACKLPPAWQ